MISRYNSFLEDKLLESVINESIVYFSPPLRKLLHKISDNEIADDLVKVEGENIKPDITFLDIDKEGYLSFITMRNAVNLAKVKYAHIVDGGRNSIDIQPNTTTSDSIWRHDIEQEYDDLGIFKKSRNQVKIGKLVNKLLPNKFTDKQIEEFVNLFKATLEKQGEKFDLVEGEDIGFWYNSKNYKEKNGTLGNSCMASKSGIFQLYTHNPEVCKLLILKEDDKLLGRALVWKLNSINRKFDKKEGEDTIEVKPEYFMDRQYTINDSDIIKFKKYAEEKGWAYKSNNNHYSYESVTFLGQTKNSNMTVILKPYKGTSDYDYQRYPYLDTFRRYDPGTGYLYNDEDNDRDNQGHYILEDTGGGYREVESGYYSEWEDRMIDEDDAVYSDPVNSYLTRDSAVEVERGSRGNRGWWPEGHDEIVFDEHLGEHLHQDDCRYSEIDNEWVYEDNCASVVTEIDDEGYINGDDEWIYNESPKVISLTGLRSKTWYQKISDIDGNWESKTKVLKSLMIKDHNDEWIPKIFSIYQSKVSDPIDEYPSDITGFEYLNEVDAIALGYSVERHQPQLVDTYSYTDRISVLLPTIKAKLRKKVEKLKYELGGNQLSLFGDDKDHKKKLEDRMNWYLSRLEQIEEEKWV